MKNQKKILFYKFIDVINSCRLGRLHNIFDRNVCFDHCTLREDCNGIDVSEGGCRLCLSAEYDVSRQDSVDFSRIYINRNAMRGNA